MAAHAADFDRPEETAGPLCFKCRKRDRRAVYTGITEDDRVVWHCAICGTQGQISNWQGSLWDPTSGQLSD